MQALSLDLRQRIVAALEAGQKRAEIAARFDVSEASVYRLQRQWKRHNDLTPRKRTGRQPRLSNEGLAQLQEIIAQQSDPTGASLVEAWQASTGKRVGLSTMHRALHRLQLAYKKSAASPASETRGSAPPSEKP